MNDSDLSPMGQLAVETAKQGVKIFPINPVTKKPYPNFSGWPELATNDLKSIREWWIIRPEAMIGALTGEPNGFFVLDIDVGDGKQGLKSLAALERVYGELPATMVVRTPSGGLHFYFQMPEGADIRNSASGIAEDIDVRGTGGYIAFAGSQRHDGKYEIVEDWRAQCL
jgi:hypothetical protein